VLAICGGALATLNPDQLRAFARTNPNLVLKGGVLGPRLHQRQPDLDLCENVVRGLV